MSNVIQLNDANFDAEVKNSEQPVLVDFFATWCGPCRMQLPIIDEVADSFSGKAKVCKINVDDGAEKSAEFGVSSIPALLVFDKGRIVERMVGLHTKGQLSDILNRYL